MGTLFRVFSKNYAINLKTLPHLAKYVSMGLSKISTQKKIETNKPKVKICPPLISFKTSVIDYRFFFIQRITNSSFDIHTYIHST